MFVCRSTTRTASSVRPTVKTCRPAPSPTLPWCTRRRPSTRCLRAPRGPLLSPPAQVRHRDVINIHSCWAERAANGNCSDWQITLRQPASLLTHPIPAACRLPLQPTTTEPCLSPTLGPSGLRTTGTAGEWTAGRPTRVVSLENALANGAVWCLWSVCDPLDFDHVWFSLTFSKQKSMV